MVKPHRNKLFKRLWRWWGHGSIGRYEKYYTKRQLCYGSKETIKEGAQGEQNISNPLLVRGVKMKILAVAALVVVLCCLEVALSYPTPRHPQAKFQEKTPFKMTGKPRGFSRAYLAEYNAEIE